MFTFGGAPQMDLARAASEAHGRIWLNVFYIACMDAYMYIIYDDPHMDILYLDIFGYVYI